MPDSPRRVLTPWKVGVAYALACVVFAVMLVAAPAVRSYQVWEGTVVHTAWGVAALAVVAAGWALVGLRRGGGRVERWSASAALLVAGVSLAIAAYVMWDDGVLFQRSQEFVEAEAEQIGQEISANRAEDE